MPWPEPAGFLAGRAASVGAVLPCTWADVSGDVLEESRSVERAGFSDARVRLSVPLTGEQSLKFAWSDGTTTRIGTDFTTWTVAWQYAW